MPATRHRRYIVQGRYAEVDLNRDLSAAAYDNDKYRDKLRNDYGFEYDPELSDKNVSVYYSPKEQRAIASYRGTKMSNIDDLAADFDILQGKRQHHRFSEAVQHAKRANQKYKNLSTTGHSLGGTLALHVNKQLGLPARVYNPGSSPFSQEHYNNDNVYIHKSAMDPISMNAHGKHEERKVIKPKFKDVTSLQGFFNYLLKNHGLFS
jgi:putative lipase involved disintegration of autophagic bodies